MTLKDDLIFARLMYGAKAINAISQTALTTINANKNRGEGTIQEDWVNQ
jgi:hypothetical protein